VRKLLAGRSRQWLGADACRSSAWRPWDRRGRAGVAAGGGAHPGRRAVLPAALPGPRVALAAVAPRGHGPHALRSHSQGSGGSASRITRRSFVAGQSLSPRPVPSLVACGTVPDARPRGRAATRSRSAAGGQRRSPGRPRRSARRSRGWPLPAAGRAPPGYATGSRTQTARGLPGRGAARRVGLRVGWPVARAAATRGCSWTRTCIAAYSRRRGAISTGSTSRTIEARSV